MVFCVITDCPIGRFGHNCNKECHCQDSGEACDSIMGMCQSDCAPGWDGFDCQNRKIHLRSKYKYAMYVPTAP